MTTVQNMATTDEPSAADTGTPPDQIALSLASPAASGHFDELRGITAAPEKATAPGLAAPWSQFVSELGTEGFADLNRRQEAMQNQLVDNGVTYNVYADTNGPQRPWELDLFPLIITPESWQQIEAGVLQRVRVLDRVMADVYGPRELIKSG